ncbi:LysR substrate-binding domain-containing protein [Limimaricola sp.]|uniref:LysR substrate-binding domain-containing protein n=1 Tax=Limimaricola sp. TaxID=2211665 RepID=UPI0025B8F1CF|nr:LysR substrate-binding domain-containing protein [Limimaricola sp.]
MTGPLPPLSCLRAFLAVAEHENFTRAAETLGLTQTAVSHQIAQLETFLGAPVFVRQRPGVALTPLGTQIRPAIQTALAQLHDTLHAARRTRSERKITVSTIPEFGSRWLAPRLADFFEAHPGIGVNLVMEYRRADVLGGEVDAAIWLGPGSPDLQATPLGLDEEFAVCAPELARTLPPQMALTTAPLLRYTGARHTLLDWRRWLAQLYPMQDAAKFFDFDGGPEFDSFAEMIAACQRGEGFALVRRSLVSDALAAGDLVRCFVETATSDLQYHLVTAGKLRPGSPLARFHQWLLAQIEDEAAG